MSSLPPKRPPPSQPPSGPPRKPPPRIPKAPGDGVPSRKPPPRPKRAPPKRRLPPSVPSKHTSLTSHARKAPPPARSSANETTRTRTGVVDDVVSVPTRSRGLSKPNGDVDLNVLSSMVVACTVPDLDFGDVPAPPSFSDSSSADETCFVSPVIGCVPELPPPPVTGGDSADVAVNFDDVFGEVMQNLKLSGTQPEQPQPQSQPEQSQSQPEQPQAQSQPEQSQSQPEPEPEQSPPQHTQGPHQTPEATKDPQHTQGPDADVGDDGDVDSQEFDSDDEDVDTPVDTSSPLEEDAPVQVQPDVSVATQDTSVPLDEGVEQEQESVASAAQDTRHGEPRLNAFFNPTVAKESSKVTPSTSTTTTTTTTTSTTRALSGTLEGLQTGDTSDESSSSSYAEHSTTTNALDQLYDDVTHAEPYYEEDFSSGDEDSDPDDPKMDTKVRFEDVESKCEEDSDDVCSDQESDAQLVGNAFACVVSVRTANDLNRECFECVHFVQNKNDPDCDQLGNNNSNAQCADVQDWVSLCPFAAGAASGNLTSCRLPIAPQYGSVTAFSMLTDVLDTYAMVSRMEPEIAKISQRVAKEVEAEVKALSDAPASVVDPSLAQLPRGRKRSTTYRRESGIRVMQDIQNTQQRLVSMTPSGHDALAANKHQNTQGQDSMASPVVPKRPNRKRSVLLSAGQLLSPLPEDRELAESELLVEEDAHSEADDENTGARRHGRAYSMSGTHNVDLLVSEGRSKMKSLQQQKRERLSRVRGNKRASRLGDGSKMGLLSSYIPRQVLERYVHRKKPYSGFRNDRTTYNTADYRRNKWGVAIQGHSQTCILCRKHKLDCTCAALAGSGGRGKSAAFSQLPTTCESYTLPHSALMIADISGFTKLNETFARMGAVGAEKVTFHLNSYFSQLLSIIDRHGGDCIKFAGDALIVLFSDDFRASNSYASKMKELPCTLLEKVTKECKAYQTDFPIPNTDLRIGPCITGSALLDFVCEMIKNGEFGTHVHDDSSKGVRRLAGLYVRVLFLHGLRCIDLSSPGQLDGDDLFSFVEMDAWWNSHVLDADNAVYSFMQDVPKIHRVMTGNDVSGGQGEEMLDFVGYVAGHGHNNCPKPPDFDAKIDHGRERTRAVFNHQDSKSANGNDGTTDSTHGSDVHSSDRESSNSNHKSTDEESKIDESPFFNKRNAWMTAVRAVNCALELQQKGEYTATQGGVKLSLHCAIGHGDVFAFHVGGYNNEWEFLLAGAPFAQLQAGLDMSKSGDVVVSSEAWRMVRPWCVSDPLKISADYLKRKHLDLSTKVYRIVHLGWAIPAFPLDPMPLPDLLEPAVRAYVPRGVLAKLDAEMSAYLPELRVAAVIFVNLKGLVLNTATSNDPTKAHQALLGLQKIVAENGGYRRQFLVDDKGSVLIVVFGVPGYSHDNNSQQAVACAFQLRDFLNSMLMEHTIGIATGNVYVGSVGSPSRHEYAVVGDTVNTSARLSGRATAGSILVETRCFESCRSKFQMRPIGSIKVKGKDVVLETYEPVAVDKMAEMNVNSGAVVGRGLETTVFMEELMKVQKGGKGGAMWIDGPAGVGKTSLVRNFYRMARVNVDTLYVSVDANTRTYATIWKDIIEDILSLNAKSKRRGVSLEELNSPKRKQERFLEWCLSHLKSSKKKYFPLINQILVDFNIPPTKFSRNLIGKPIQMRAALTKFLCSIVTTKYGRSGAVWIIENMHLVDNASLRYLMELLKHKQSRVLVVCTSRPEKQFDKVRAAKQALSEIKKITPRFVRLGGLEKSWCARLLCSRFHYNAVQDELLDLVYNRSKGNPLYVIEVTEALKDANVFYVTKDGEAMLTKKNDEKRSSVHIPNSLKTLIVAKVDNLPPVEGLVLKLASVFGMRFPVVGLEFLMQKEGGAAHELRNFLAKLQRKGLVQVKNDQGVFLQELVQQGCYNLLVLSLRCRLHCIIAKWYELYAKNDQISDNPFADPNVSSTSGNAESKAETKKSIDSRILLCCYHYSRGVRSVGGSAETKLLRKAFHYINLLWEFSINQQALYEAKRWSSEALQIFGSLPSEVKKVLRQEYRVLRDNIAGRPPKALLDLIAKQRKERQQQSGNSQSRRRQSRGDASSSGNNGGRTSSFRKPISLDTSQGFGSSRRRPGGGNGGENGD